MFIADTLSLAYRLTTEDTQHDTSKVCALREGHHELRLSVSPKRLQGLNRVTGDDQDMQQFLSTIHHG